MGPIWPHFLIFLEFFRWFLVAFEMGLVWKVFKDAGNWLDCLGDFLEV